MKVISQSITIMLASATVFLILSTALSDYLAPILGFLIAVSLIYIITQKRRNKGQELLTGTNFEVFGITTAVLLIIFLTGAIQSNLFFLIYFLLFGLAFLFEPATVFVFVICMSLIFMDATLKGDVFSNLIRGGSIIFLSPIAFFFGREFKRRESLEDEIEKASSDIVEDADALLHSETATKKEEDVEEIDDIIEKTQELRSKLDK